MCLPGILEVWISHFWLIRSEALIDTLVTNMHGLNIPTWDSEHINTAPCHLCEFQTELQWPICSRQDAKDSKRSSAVHRFLWETFYLSYLSYRIKNTFFVRPRSFKVLSTKTGKGIRDCSRKWKCFIGIIECKRSAFFSDYWKLSVKHDLAERRPSVAVFLLTCRRLFLTFRYLFS